MESVGVSAAFTRFNAIEGNPKVQAILQSNWQTSRGFCSLAGILLSKQYFCIKSDCRRDVAISLKISWLHWCIRYGHIPSQCDGRFRLGPSLMLIHCNVPRSHIHSCEEAVIMYICPSPLMVLVSGLRSPLCQLWISSMAMPGQLHPTARSCWIYSSPGEAYPESRPYIAQKIPFRMTPDVLSVASSFVSAASDIVGLAWGSFMPQ